MESTPVGVIVGLFSAISQKLPALSEWDSRKHHTLLNSNFAVCEALTEVQEHVTRYGEHYCCETVCTYLMGYRCLFEVTPFRHLQS